MLKRFTTIEALASCALLAPFFTPPAMADEIADQTDAILQEAALDDRMADNGTTPIAVTDGDQIYGARPTEIP